ncbi:MAG: hypothetical protein ACRYGO_11380 [Janthinobacterium lividum]
MKRLLVLLLLVLMPLQLAWAASGICCAPDEKVATQHVCHPWQQSQQQCGDDDAGATGAAADDDGCDCCHHLAGSALVASPPALAAPARYPALRFDPPHYVSHIPDLVPPPDRPSRA